MSMTIGAYEFFVPPIEPMPVDITIYGHPAISLVPSKPTATAERNENVWDYVYDYEQVDSKGMPVRIGLFNDRLTDIVSWLPTSLQDSQTAELVAKFQNIVNTFYDVPCRWDGFPLTISTLKKIEGILDFRDPDNISSNLLYAYARQLGFDIFNKLGMSQSDSDSLLQIRELARSIPFAYANKTSFRGIAELLATFGIIIELNPLWCDTEENYAAAAFIEEEDEPPSGYNPTPHFNVRINVDSSSAAMMDAVTRAKTVINDFKPVNTVFDGIALVTRRYTFSQLEDGENLASLRITVPDFWTDLVVDMPDGPIYEPST